MYRWLVVWQAYSMCVVSGMLDVRVLSPRYSGTQFECFDYPSAMPLRSFDSGWQIQKKLTSMLDITTPRYWPSATQDHNEISRRIDLLWNRDDIVKEHAKLVQDINSLKQVMYVAPVAEERDYDDSVFPEIIETFPSTTSRPTSTRSVRPTKSSFPILLLGGGSRRHSTKSQPPKLPKKTISLVGTAAPVARHPYPFVMAASSHQPVRICMQSPLMYSTATRRPSLWERLVRAIVPR
ncbi:uncharacterized protein LOC112055109 [Bicyclus anynana]|uniref:Uncharacterized protein LOC112055109 n=1 Tax=Bicyclus anynana TaxID=110368 RepID=A0A6J1NW11_BICAN|nr:uncharacterized protein LOC112055109 [Bicyclus anynana]